MEVLLLLCVVPFAFLSIFGIILGLTGLNDAMLFSSRFGLCYLGSGFVCFLLILLTLPAVMYIQNISWSALYLVMYVICYGVLCFFLASIDATWDDYILECKQVHLTKK